MIRKSVLALVVVSLGLAACAAPASTAPTPSGTGTQAALDCSPATLPTLNPGTLTVSTAKPAYPPYVLGDDPTKGKGFEAALAYDVAEELGYTADQVEWTFVTFEQTYAPGGKTYDFGLQQVGITPKREKAITFSRPYYVGPQALLALEGTAGADATTFDAVKTLKIGVQVGTTSLEYVQDIVQPAEQVQVFNDTEGSKRALRNGTIDAIVTDLPTAFYLANVEISGSTVVGQFGGEGADGESWGLVLKMGNPLVECVNEALDALDANGTLDALREKWLSDSEVAVIEP